MPPVVIENPILNSPFDEPGRHFKFGEEGITSEVVEGRRTSSYFIPIAQPRKKGKQLQFDTEWTSDRLEENRLVNLVRERVGPTEKIAVKVSVCPWPENGGCSSDRYNFLIAAQWIKPTSGTSRSSRTSTMASRRKKPPKLEIAANSPM